MILRRLGGARGLNVSGLCLGTMFFGTRVDEATSFAILDRFVERGGTFLDTANSYAYWVKGGRGGESESLLGGWMASRGTRDTTVVATKVGALPTRPGADLDEAEGLAARVIQERAVASMRRLQTDHLDVYYAHWEDRRVPLEETVGAFAHLVGKGDVGLLGVSNHRTWRVERARSIARAKGIPGYGCVQQGFSYLQPRPGADTWPNMLVDSELLDYVGSESDLTLLAYSPLLGGAYARHERLASYYEHEGTRDRMLALQEVATDLDATSSQVVLSWLVHGDPPVIPVIGVSSVSHLDECMDAVELRLGTAHRRHLNEAGQP